MVTDFEKEEKVLRAIQEILTRLEGRKDSQPTLINMVNVLMEDSFKQPIELLDRLDELLSRLKEVDWDVSIPLQAKDSVRKDIIQSIDNMGNILTKDYPNPYQQIEEYAAEYRKFLYCLLYIQNLTNSVRSLCKNYRIATQKLLGESDEKLE